MLNLPSLRSAPVLPAGAGTHVAVWNQDNNSGDTVHTINDGTITGHSSYYAATSHSIDDVQNSGTMNGDVWLSDGHGSTFNSFGGTLNGTVHCGAGGDNVTLGKTGGAVVSGTGADNLTANGTSGSTFIYDSFSESSHANNSVDHINDFRSGYDKIDLSAIVNNPNALPQYAVEITPTDNTGDYKVTMTAMITATSSRSTSTPHPAACTFPTSWCTTDEG